MLISLGGCDGVIDRMIEAHLTRIDEAMLNCPYFTEDAVLKLFAETLGWEHLAEIPANSVPTEFIESDDPGIVGKARELTEGSADSWEATRRLSEWVSTEIVYSIPGGGSARGVYEAKAGECGGHSVLLAAFCRSVGIPARMVWGIMYVPNHEPMAIGII